MPGLGDPGLSGRSARDPGWGWINPGLPGLPQSRPEILLARAVYPGPSRSARAPQFGLCPNWGLAGLDWDIRALREGPGLGSPDLPGLTEIPLGSR